MKSWPSDFSCRCIKYDKALGVHWSGDPLAIFGQKERVDFQPILKNLVAMPRLLFTTAAHSEHNTDPHNTDTKIPCKPGNTEASHDCR